MKFRITATLLIISASTWAVTPGTWRHASEASFTTGEFKTTVVNSRGDISLAREIKILMGAKDAPAIVSAVAADGKTIYAASGASGDIYKIADGKSQPFAKLPASIVTALVWTGNDLLAGGGGNDAGIYRIADDGKVAPVWTDPEVKYVWSIVSVPDGPLYAATGPKARLYEVREGKGQIVYDASKFVKNLLCLARSDNGMLYAGTDQKGLVLEIDPALKTGRVVLDAPEKEIAAIVIGGAGDLYVATSDISKANAAGKIPPSPAKTGRAVPPTRPAKPAKRPTPPTGATTKKATPTKTGPAAKPIKATTRPTVKSNKGGTPPAGATTRPVVKKKTPKVAKPKNTTTKSATTRRRPSRMPRSGSRPPAGAGKGNAVYHIRANGLVKTIFRKGVTIGDMIRLDEQTLLLATGNGGAIYSLGLDSDVLTKLADTDAKVVTSLTISAGQIVFATANKGSVGALTQAAAKKGTFTAKAMDAKQIAQWGTARLRISAEPGAKVTLSTRSGNLSEPDDATWSAWSDEREIGDGFLKIASPAARFLQYRLTLSAANAPSPVVHELSLIYQVGNLAPIINALTIKPMPLPGQKSGSLPIRQLAAKAGDPNGDKLHYKIEFREIGAVNWVKIKDKQTKPAYLWDTRTVGDGVYELRLTASDAPSNASNQTLSAGRISEPVVVDNTAPLVTMLGASVKGKTVSVQGLAFDKTTRIVSIEYSVDSVNEWTAVLPSDGICDSKREKFAFEITDVKAGAHRIAVRIRDIYGNLGYQTAKITVAE